MPDAVVNFGDGSAQADATFGTPLSHVYAAGSFGITARTTDGKRGNTRAVGPGTFNITVTDAATPPAPPATGATAGTPGTFTPAGCITPATGTAIQTLTASPNTAWTVNQRVVAVNSDERYWDGSNWQTGRVPAPVATGVTAGTPATYQPAGATVPANGAGIEALPATPQTRWTVGQYAVAFNLDERFWAGSGWQTGRATAPPATGATAGNPGSFTPAGCITPADLAAMAGLTASPATAWTTGQHVITADTDYVHWDSTDWATGAAP